METIKYRFIKRKLFYKDEYMYGFYEDSSRLSMNKEEIVESVGLMKKGWIREYYDKENLSDKEYLANFRIDDNIPKPRTYPRFNNEVKFKVFWGTRNKVKIYKIQPTIIAVGWTGNSWKYHFKEIGHEFPETDEKDLVKMK